jgi:phosphate transport system ATP-binding protein
MGQIIETGTADQVFNHPQHELTRQYLTGAFS